MPVGRVIAAVAHALALVEAVALGRLLCARRGLAASVLVEVVVVGGCHIHIECLD